MKSAKLLKDLSNRKYNLLYC